MSRDAAQIQDSWAWNCQNAEDITKTTGIAIDLPVTGGYTALACQASEPLAILASLAVETLFLTRRCLTPVR
jgi:hypothetical protein